MPFLFLKCPNLLLYIYEHERVLYGIVVGDPIIITQTEIVQILFFAASSKFTRGPDIRQAGNPVLLVIFHLQRR